MATGLIGSSGFVGTELAKAVKIDHAVNSANLPDIYNQPIDVLYCAAPSANRIWVNNNVGQDLRNIQSICESIAKTSPNHLVLISTIDSLVKPETPYGAHRKLLEQWVKANVKSYSIIRLSTIIHPNIRKNYLYDLSHGQYINNVNGESLIQWCALTDAIRIAQTDVGEFNLFSEPILTADIVSKFFPNLVDKIEYNKETASVYNQAPYYYSRDDIFRLVEEYLGNC